MTHRTWQARALLNPNRLQILSRVFFEICHSFPLQANNIDDFHREISNMSMLSSGYTSFISSSLFDFLSQKFVIVYPPGVQSPSRSANSFSLLHWPEYIPEELRIYGSAANAIGLWHPQLGFLPFKVGFRSALSYGISDTDDPIRLILFFIELYYHVLNQRAEWFLRPGIKISLSTMQAPKFYFDFDDTRKDGESGKLEALCDLDHKVQELLDEALGIIEQRYAILIQFMARNIATQEHYGHIAEHDTELHRLRIEELMSYYDEYLQDYSSVDFESLGEASYSINDEAAISSLEDMQNQVFVKSPFTGRYVSVHSIPDPTSKIERIVEHLNYREDELNPGTFSDIVEIDGQYVKDRRDWWRDFGHGALDVAGMIPFIGEVADLINGTWYALEGDILNATISGAALIPFGGQAITASRLSLRQINDVRVDKMISGNATDLSGSFRPASRRAGQNAYIHGEKTSAVKRQAEELYPAPKTGDGLGAEASEATSRAMVKTCRFKGNPVDPSTGNPAIVESDFTITGSLSIPTARQYRGDDFPNSCLGPRWCDSFGMALILTDEDLSLIHI